MYGIHALSSCPENQRPGAGAEHWYLAHCMLLFQGNDSVGVLDASPPTILIHHGWDLGSWGPPGASPVGAALV